MVLRRVRIMIGGRSGSPSMMPSSVGSLDIAITASIVPASRSSPSASRSYIACRTSRARATLSSGPSTWIWSPRAEINTPRRFSTCTRLASNWPNNAPKRLWLSNVISVWARRISRWGTGGRDSAGVAPLRGLLADLRAIGSFATRPCAALRVGSLRPPPRSASTAAAWRGIVTPTQWSG